MWNYTRSSQQHKHTLRYKAQNWIDGCCSEAAAGVRWPGNQDQATNLMFYPDRCLDFTTISWLN